MQEFCEPFQILRLYANDPATRTINVRYEEKRHGKCDGQNQKKETTSFQRTITHQCVAEDGHHYHQDPRRNWNAVPPGGLRISLLVQYFVHASHGESRQR